MEEDTISLITDNVAEMVCSKCKTELDVSEMARMSEFECPACGKSLVVPCRLDHFLLKQVLGRCGMTTVFAARDETLHRNVAIKILHINYSHDTMFVENFMTSARAAGQISCPQVVRVYSVGQKGSQPFIVMELVTGGRLDQIIQKKEPVEEARMLQVTKEIITGLKAANDLGFVHGNISPSNIFFDKHGQAKIADFGAVQQEVDNAIMGTPYYIAPETVERGKIDRRSDIYSLGATMFHALTAQPPFSGETSREIINARLEQPAPGLRAIRPEISSVTAEIVDRMLETEPRRRYPNYPSLIADLDAAIAHVGPAVQAFQSGLTTVVKPTTGEHRMPRKKNPMPTILLILLVLVGAGGGFFAWYQHKQNQKAIKKEASQKPAKPQDPMLLHWNFDKLVGEYIPDMGVHDNRGKLFNINSSSIVSGVNTGSVIQFDGLNDYVARNFRKLIRDDLTVSIWFNCKQDTSQFDVPLRMVEFITKQNTVLDLCLDSGQRAGHVSIMGDAGPVRVITSKAKFNDDKWHHAAMVRSNLTISLYVDGTLQDQAVTPRSYDYAFMVLGARFDKMLKGLFMGKMDEVRLYNKALNELEIVAILEENELSFKPADKAQAQQRVRLNKK